MQTCLIRRCFSFLIANDQNFVPIIIFAYSPLLQLFSLIPALPLFSILLLPPLLFMYFFTSSHVLSSNCFLCSAPLNLTAAQTAMSNGMGSEEKIDNAIQTIMRSVSHQSVIFQFRIRSDSDSFGHQNYFYSLFSFVSFFYFSFFFNFFLIFFEHTDTERTVTEEMH